MMYTILVVDDENIIREGICSTLNDVEGINTLSAKNGKIALDIIYTEKIDAMVLDIKMPVMGGLELLKQLKQQNKQIITVILSGYDEFDYAKKAMQYGAVDYILKPFTPETVINLGNDLVNRIQQKQKREKELEELKKQLEKSKPVIKERFFNDILNNKIDKQIFEQRKNFLDININGEYYQIVIMEMEQKKENQDYTEEQFHQIMIMSMQKIINEQIRGCNCELFHLNTDLFVLLFCYTEQRLEQERTYEIVESIKNKVHQQLGIDISIGIGEVVQGIKLINESYKQAQYALNYKILVGKGNIISINDIDRKETSINNIFDEQEFINLLKLNKKEGIIEYISSIFRCVSKSQQDLSLNSLNLLCMRIISACMIAMEQTNAINEQVYTGKGTSPYIEFLKLKSLKEIEAWIINFVTNVVDFIELSRKSDCKKIIEQAKEIIYKDYDKDINLKYIADKLFLSKNYFGQLFKDQVNMSVNEYLNKVRINKAKKLLEDSNLKIYEIAFKVGFSDQYYFSSVFKKIIGVPPTEYRELL